MENDVKLYENWFELAGVDCRSSSRYKTVPYSCEDLMTFAPKEVLSFTS